MPNCQDITKHSSDYLDRNLSWWSRLGFWIHIVMCVHCRRYLEPLKLTIATISKTQAATPPDINEQCVHNVVKHIQQQQAEKKENESS